jgi:hypothetical protein
MRLVLSLLLVGYLFVTSAFAEPSQTKSPFDGVWNGSIDKLPITACFNDDIEKHRSASYYYHRHLIPIVLSGEDGAATNTSAIWREVNGVWKINSTSSDQIDGTWTSADGSRKLPIKLTRVALSADDSAVGVNPCGSNAYNEAIVASLKTIRGPVITLGKIKFRIITDALPSGRSNGYKDREQYWEIAEILGDSPAIAAINTSIRELTKERGKLDCRLSAMNHFAQEGADVHEVGISTFGRWISLNTNSYYHCYQRTPQISQDTYMWDLITGKPESPLTWFKGAEVTIYRGHIPPKGRLPDALDKFIASRFGQGDPRIHLSMSDLESCYGPYEPGNYSYQLKLVSDGIIFEIPITSNGSCGDSFKLTFKELTPFLNRKGRRFAAEIQAIQKAKQ